MLGQDVAIMYDGKPFELPALLLVRTGSATGSHSNVIISQMEQMGCLVVNPSRAIQVTMDKI
jgi:glutathione synthase/RimK-type ligase-like ATP-grasp enzyme